MIENKMSDFIVTILPSGTNYIVHAACPKFVGEAEPVTVKSSDIARLSSIAEHLNSTNSNDISLAGQLGCGIYRTVFKKGVHNLLQRARSVATDRSEGLRILFKFKQTPELHEIPWELLYDSDGKQFFAIDPATPIVRYIEQDNKVKSLEIEPPLRVLFTTACPTGQTELDLITEERHIRTAIETLGRDVELTVEQNISFRKLRHSLIRAQNRERPFHIWHHCGHGDLLNGSEKTTFALALEEDNIAQWIDVRQVSTLIKACPQIRLVTLNVCHGGSFRGLAPALASLNVPAVIGFRTGVLDQIALTFAETFFEAILHTSIDRAMGQARMALATAYNRSLDWGMPLLFLRTSNSVLLPRPKAENTTTSTNKLRADSMTGPMIKFKGNWKAKKAKTIGVLNIGDKAQAQPNLQVEFDPSSFETDDLVQIGGLSISSDEASKRFADLKNLAQSILNDL